MYIKDLFSYWVIAGLVTIVFGVVCDVTSAATNWWGWAEKDTYYTFVGLFKICNGTREVTRRDKLEIYRLEPTCYFPTELDQNDWIVWTMGMQCMGLVCGLITCITVVGFLISLRCDYIRSRSALVAIIPMAILTAAFNIIGVFTFATGIGQIENTPNWSMAIDVVGIACFIIGSTLCILDIQGCCMKRRPTVGKGLTRPI